MALEKYLGTWIMCVTTKMTSVLLYWISYYGTNVVCIVIVVRLPSRVAEVVKIQDDSYRMLKPTGKVQRILKSRKWPMSQSGKCKDNLNFCAHYGAAEKNKAKV